MIKLVLQRLCKWQEILTLNPFLHGDIYIGFTPDEEIGRGADLFDLGFLRRNLPIQWMVFSWWALNMKTSMLQLLTLALLVNPFTQVQQKINFGQCHAYSRLKFHQMLPTFLNPAYTEGYEGFNHLSHMNGSVEDAALSYIIRNHDMAKFNAQKRRLQAVVTYLNHKYGYEGCKS